MVWCIMDVEYILYEVVVFVPLRGYKYPLRFIDYNQALKEFEFKCSYYKQGYDRVYLEGIDSNGNSITLEEY